ncbi:hypothetical protein [Pontibacillus yanchengensis]|uniref:Uncharacterized protein n=1 Tax=Pontibacillus yanchengensis Y32 TaxID=1385514 RepID=A0A0A2TI51_9BACI|nr:hypothetical protein [Pontibacillus yanchengensis]KGP74133.1 hypothetical protein N782_17545 [Pontibacillus yanchengensis Y32]
MKYNKSITTLVLVIGCLAFVATVVGIFSSGGVGPKEIRTLHDEVITLHGKGLYQFDSVSGASQVIAQDIVTLCLSIPLLFISLFWSRKGSIKGRLMLVGTISYFLYTYASYAFLLMYNPLFLLYVILLSASFFAFTLVMMSFDYENLHTYFHNNLPTKFIGGFLFSLSFLLLFLWLGRIVPPLLNGGVPVGLEHYTTLVIQVLDLAFIVPVAILGGILVLKRNGIGYLLAAILIVKGITMLTAITAMILNQARAGIPMTVMEYALFPAFNIVVMYCLYVLLKHVQEPRIPGGIMDEDTNLVRN